jgi:hypothetical protein
MLQRIAVAKGPRGLEARAEPIVGAIGKTRTLVSQSNTPSWPPRLQFVSTVRYHLLCIA